MAAKVKICGLTRPHDADLAVASGAWALGLNFSEHSPRRIDVDTAAEIATAQRRRAEVVGVFVNAPLDEVLATLASVPLTMLQLHGDEGPAYCAEAARRTGLKVIKVMRVKDAHAVKALSAYKTDLHLLDAHVRGAYGGTGERFDWELAAAHPGRPPLVLAYSGSADPEAYGMPYQDLFSPALVSREHVDDPVPPRAPQVLLAVGTKVLQSEPRFFGWLAKNRRPAAVIGGCFFIYDISNDPEAFRWMAAVYLGTRRPGKARAALERARFLDPGNPDDERLISQL